jgi:chromosome segregation ATPase
MDLQSFQDILKQRPLDREKVVSKIESNMRWWAKLFESPPIEVKRLMDGFDALREAFTLDLQSLAASFTSSQTQATGRTTMIEGHQHTVAATHVSMVEITKSFEELLSSQELRIQQHSSRIQELKSQIEELNAQLGVASEAYAHEKDLKQRTARCLDKHQERLKEASALQSQLEVTLGKEQKRLQDLEQATVRLTGQDDDGLTERARSLMNFFLSCSFEP